MASVLLQQRVQIYDGVVELVWTERLLALGSSRCHRVPRAHLLVSSETNRASFAHKRSEAWSPKAAINYHSRSLLCLLFSPATAIAWRFLLLVVRSLLRPRQDHPGPAMAAPPGSPRTPRMADHEGFFLVLALLFSSCSLLFSSFHMRRSCSQRVFWSGY